MADGEKLSQTAEKLRAGVALDQRQAIRNGLSSPGPLAYEHVFRAIWMVDSTPRDGETPLQEDDFDTAVLAHARMMALRDSETIAAECGLVVRLGRLMAEHAVEPPPEYMVTIEAPHHI